MLFFHGILPCWCWAALLHAAVALERIPVRDASISRSFLQSKAAAYSQGEAPTVYVQDFLDIFQATPPSLRSLGLDTRSMYGKELAPGDGSGFIRNETMAPDHFRVKENAQWAYSVETASRDPVEMQLEFDEFCLERLMLAKWLERSITCDDEACARSANVVVVPSLIFHAMLSEGFNWTTIEAHAGNVALHLKFLKMLLAKYPSNNEKNRVFVIHSPFVNGSPKGLYDSMFLALAILPSALQRRFIIASIESNLGKNLRGIYGSTWSVSAQVQNQQRQRGEDHGGPLLVTMPYPIPVVTPVKWTQDKLPYKAPMRRPISMIFLGASAKGAGVEEGNHNIIRPLVIDFLTTQGHMQSYKPNVHAGPMARVDYGVVCLDPTQSNGTACGIGANASFWELTVGSDFCLQPPGDTLTRSHFYMAVLSGCIPIIFDGGHKNFNPWEHTWWSWRGSQALAHPLNLPQGSPSDVRPLWEVSESGSPFFDYREFTVVADASEVRNIAKMTAFLRRVLKLPYDHPERFLQMRRNLDRIAPLLSYRGNLHPDAPDAFIAFEALVKMQVNIPAMNRTKD